MHDAHREAAQAQGSGGYEGEWQHGRGGAVGFGGGTTRAVVALRVSSCSGVFERENTGWKRERERER